MHSDACTIIVPINNQLDFVCDESLREAERRGYPVRRVRGHSAIDVGRSVMASGALRDGFDELLWIDSDIAFHPDDVDRLRGHNLPIICGLYPKKGQRQFACEFLPGTQSVAFGRAGGLTEVKYAGFGFTYTRREVYDAIRTQLQLPECNQRFGPPIVPYFLPELVPDGPGQWYLAEDYAFCERARRCGFKIMADTSIRLQHLGTYGYSWEDAGSVKERYANYTYRLTDARPAEPPPALFEPVHAAVGTAGGYTRDWFTHNAPVLDAVLAPLKGTPARGLEVGVFEGRSTVWLLEHILTHSDATLTWIDTFEGGPDHAGMDLSGLEDRFRANTAAHAHKLTGHKGKSQEVLKTLPPASFDFAYIDASHEAADVLADAVLTWPLLKPGGLLGFDDYEWHLNPAPEHRPGPGIDAFLSAMCGRYDLVHKGYQVWVRKDK